MIGERLKAVRRTSATATSSWQTTATGSRTRRSPCDDRRSEPGEGSSPVSLACGPNINGASVDHGRDGNVVTTIEDLFLSDDRINGGYFIVRRALFDWMEPGDESSGDYRASSPKGKVLAYPYEGFSDRWTRSRTTSGSRRCTRPGGAPWKKVGLHAGTTRGRTDAPALPRRPRYAGAPRPSDRRPRRRHRDRLRRNAAPTDTRRPDVEVTWIVLACRGSEAAEARAAPTPFLRVRRPPRC